jgi:hypothetical protein
VAVAAGAGASDSTLQNWKAQVVNLKRENTEANAKIKQLETELKKGRPGTGAATDDVSSRHCQNLVFSKTLRQYPAAHEEHPLLAYMI